jgi:L-ribulose-5-phosphate 4-epimerase
MQEDLKKTVCEANLELQEHKLVIYSWGNVSGIDHSAGLVVIKPSGVPYNELTPDKMVVLDLELYKNFKTIGGICHTHSPSATMWAQACKEIPCFGTTHADNFYGPVPVTDIMTNEEIQENYELNTGKVIVKRFTGLDPMQMPAVLVANHGPFTWGADPADAVEENVVLEQIATMALGTITINPEQGPINRALLDKHYLRKHGKNAYYGQPRS